VSSSILVEFVFSWALSIGLVEFALGPILGLVLTRRLSLVFSLGSGGSVLVASEDTVAEKNKTRQIQNIIVTSCVPATFELFSPFSVLQLWEGQLFHHALYVDLWNHKRMQKTFSFRTFTYAL